MSSINDNPLNLRYSRWLIRTKLEPSQIGSDHIARPSLIEQLNQTITVRVTLLLAAAGFGKTDILQQWYKGTTDNKLLAGWLTLDESDGDPRQFIHYIIAALTSAGIDLVGLSNAAQDGLQNISEDSIFAGILNGLRLDKRQVVLILDDYYRAETPATRNILQNLVSKAPDNFHLVIATREFPAFALEYLRVQGLLLELNSWDLRFSREEISTYINTHAGHSLSRQELSALAEHTEGWPIAIKMANHWLHKGSAAAEVIANISGRNVDVARYLSEQVLINIPEDLQSVLLRVALTERFNGDLINVLCDRDDGWTLLESLELQSLFIIPLDKERNWYRYHHIFLEYLRSRLQRTEKVDLSMLHKKIALWFVDKQLLHEAFHHAWLVDDETFLAELLERLGGWRLIAAGYITLMKQAILHIKKEKIDNYLGLILGRIHLCVKEGNILIAREEYELLRQRTKNFTVFNEKEINYATRLDIKIVGDLISDYEDPPMTPGKISDLKRILVEIRGDEPMFQATICESLCDKYYDIGEFNEAFELTDRIIKHYRSCNSQYGEVFGLFHKHKILMEQGKLTQAGEQIEAANNLISKYFGSKTDQAANAGAYQAQLLYAKNQVNDAEKIIDWALPHMERHDAWFDVYTAAYSTASRIQLCLHGFEAAQSVLERGQVVAHSRNYSRLKLILQIHQIENLIKTSQKDSAGEFTELINLKKLALFTDDQYFLSRRITQAAGAVYARICMEEGETEMALKTLTPLYNNAIKIGHRKYQIEMALLQALILFDREELESAIEKLLEAVTIGVFSGFKRLFIDEGIGLLNLLDTTYKHHRKYKVGKFELEFIKEISKAIRTEVKNIESRCNIHGLTKKEQAVLEQLARGCTNKEISRDLHISDNEIKYALKTLFAKLEVNSRKEAVSIANQRCIIS